MYAELHTPPPQLLTQINPQRCTVKTPHNISQLQQHTELLKDRLKHRTQSPSSPTERACLEPIDQGCELAMHSAVLLATESERLLAEYQHQKHKRAQRRSYVAKGGVLTATEAITIIEERQNEEVEPIEPVEDLVKKRAPPKCSLCGSLDQKAPTCPVNRSK